ncbi:MAG TPA: glycine cleavage system protein GcvH [Terriglobales bacterium]|nr:glycine cleavage system protein GcvH [Terriglobales bacterium]
MVYPNNLKYTKEHEWVKLDGKTAEVGITNYAQEALGDIVFVELPKIGAEVQKGKPLGTVESVKSVSEIYAPVSGKVVALNEELATAPEKINSDAHSAWMVRVELKDPAEAGGLLSAADYEKFVAEEAGQ